MSKERIINWIVCELDFIKSGEQNEKLINVLNEGFDKFEKELKDDS